jgi:ribosome maturation factor RimP
MDKGRIDKVKELIETHLNTCDFQMIELQFKKGKGRDILKILIDKEEGGITVAECAKVNEEIGLLLDKSNLLERSYLLEVSSPGLDRPLITKEDFKRKKGKTVQIITKEALWEEKKEFMGVITDVDNDTVTIKTKEDESYKIPFVAIKKAKVRLEW